MVRDMTHGSPIKHMLIFSIPLLIGNIFQQFYNFTDTAIVGKTLGYEPLAAVGSTGALTFLVFGFYFGLTSGLAVITGQRFGANDPEGVRKSVAASVIICTVLSVITTAGCCLLTTQMLQWMNTPEKIFNDAYSYLFIIFLGTAALVFYGLLSSVLRALGDSLTPLIFLAVSCVLNVGLDLLFILEFSWGIQGAAWATVIAQFLSGFLCLLYIIRKFPILHLHWCNWNVSRRFYMEHIRVALPMALQFSITAVGCVILQAVLNKFGAIFIAASTIAGRIDSISIQPMFSFGIAIAAFAAQNYGARNPQRIRDGVRSCSIMSLIFSTVTGIAIIVFAQPIARLFLNEETPDVIRYTQTIVNINCGFYWFLTMLLIYRNALQGMGHSFWPMMAGVAELVIRTAAALFLADWFGFYGVCIANPLAWIGADVLLVVNYLIVMRKILRDGIPSGDGLVRRTETMQKK